MNYLINPPHFDINVPGFLRRRYLLGFVRKMIHWSFAEYFSAISYFEKIGDARSAAMIKKHFTAETVLSRHPDFKKMCQAIDTEIYNSFDKKERQFLRNAYFASGQP